MNGEADTVLSGAAPGWFGKLPGMDDFAHRRLPDGFSRAYLHHLDRCGEMLGPMLTTIHNLHYYLNLMREIREALDAGRFEAWRAQFAADRARGV